MKPLSLAIEGLHSFSDQQTIDFERLSDLSIFGIFGPTGSGKSTILDGLTLALYGDIPDGLAGSVNHNKKQINVSFEFLIGTENERKKYRVDRTFKRAEGHSVRHQSSRIMEVDEDGGYTVLADSKSGVSAQIESIIGLSMDDFTRAVVLPQGKFAEFLQLKPRDRTQMLERIFSLEKYGTRFVEQVNAAKKKLTDDIRQTNEVLLTLDDATPDALQNAVTEAHQKEALATQAGTTLTEAQQQHKEAQIIFTLQESLQELMVKEEQHQASKAYWKGILQQVSRAKEAQLVQPFLLRRNEALSAQDSLQKELANVNERLQKDELKTLEAQVALQQANATWTQKSPLLTAKQAQLVEAASLEEAIVVSSRDLDTFVIDVQQQKADYVSIKCKQEALLIKRKETQERLTKLTKILDTSQVNPLFREQLLHAVNLAQQSQVAADVVKKALQAKQERIVAEQQAKATMEAISQDRVAWRQRQVALLARREKLLITAPPTLSLLQEREWAFSELQRYSNEWLAVQHDIVEWRKQKADALIAVDNANRDLHHVEESLSHMLSDSLDRELQSAVIRIAQSLVEGAPCPVCGSHTHPSLAHTSSRGVSSISPSLPTQSLPFEGELLQGESVRELEEKRTGYRDTIVRETVVIDTLTKRIEETHLRLVTIIQALQAQQNVPLPSDLLPNNFQADDFLENEQTKHAEKFAAFILSAHQQFVRERKQREDFDAVMHAIDEEEKQLQEHSQENERMAAGAAVALQHADDELQKALSYIEEALLAKRMAQQNLLESLKPLSLQFDAPDSYDPSAKLRIELDKISAMDKARHQAQSDWQQQQDILRSLEADLQIVEQAMHDKNEKLIRQEQSLDHLQEDLAQKTEQLTSITGGLARSDALQSVQQDLMHLKQAMEFADHAAKQQKVQLDQDLREQASLEGRLLDALSHSTKHEEALCAVKLREGFVNDKDVLEALMDEADIVRLLEGLETFEENGRLLAEKRREILAELADRSITKEAFQRIIDTLQQTQNAYHEALEMRGAATERLTTTRERHHQWQHYESLQKQLEIEFSHTKLLSELFAGNHFVEFLSREQMTVIAHMASDRLAQLTNGRYALVLDADGSFLMRDDHNGSTQRPVSTLSGGETFLTSLSLALSLSMQVQLRGRYPLEFFFLDEGFGTLDPDLLDVVMSSLERLHHDRLTIGVISHVPELRARMLRRLIVSSAEPSSLQGTTVRIERA